MMFASKTPRDLNSDPTPYVIKGENNTWRETVSQGEFFIANADVYAPRITARFDPRPEFDHVQHNEPNPILVEFRRVHNLPHLTAAGAPWLARHWILNWHIHREGHDDASDAQIEHAHRVLTRIARFTEVVS